MSEVLSIIPDYDVTDENSRKLLGERGEALAVKHLIEKGYRIVVTNFKVPVGRNSKGVSVTGEIDIIALDGETLCFIEVKTRRSKDFIAISRNVDIHKQRQISRTAKIYRRIFNIENSNIRFDVVTVLIPKHSNIEIEHKRAFWNESSFNKKRWMIPF